MSQVAEKYLESYLQSPMPIGKELEILFSPQYPITIFDIGCCEAEDSIRYALKYPNAKVFAFEPLPGNLATIHKNLDKTKLSNRISVFPLAISDKTGKAQFHVSSSSEEIVSNKSSSLRSPKDHLLLYDKVAFEETLEVETQSLDDFLVEHPSVDKIDLIHMDVQGCELDVLKGAKNSLNRIKAIWLEVSSKELYEGQAKADEIRSFLENNHFTLAKNHVFHHYGEQLYLRKDAFDNRAIQKVKWSGRKSFFQEIVKKITKKFF